MSVLVRILAIVLGWGEQKPRARESMASITYVPDRERAGSHRAR
jgi:hypothetical protein